MPQLRMEYKERFPEGTSANVELCQSDLGHMALVTYDGGNPFNHEIELKIWRPEIAKNACEKLNCKPHELYYIEQVGQHWQAVPFEWDANGVIVPMEKRVTGVPAQAVKEEIYRHTRQSMGEEHLNAPDWHKHLTLPDGPDR